MARASAEAGRASASAGADGGLGVVVGAASGATPRFEEAAEAARGRRQSARRRHRSLRGLARVSARARAAGAKAHADERLHAVAVEAAARLGHPGVGSLVRARVAAGAGPAAVSREMGLHKDWLSRHLATLDPAVAAESGMSHPAVSAARRRHGVAEVLR
jgi:hypothetical protein